MKNRKQWKRTLAFTFALAVTAGALSNNAAALLNGNRMTAAAAEADEQAEETNTAKSEQSEGSVSEEAAFTDGSEEADDTNKDTDDAAEEDEAKDKAVRTVMLYICGSNLEADGGSATFNLHQILGSDFGKNDDVNVVVMTGGSDQWRTESEYLYDPATGTSPGEISSEYNQIWEAKGISDSEHPGQLVLLDGDGLRGDGEDAKPSEEELMTDTDTLKAFINYSAENFPAEMYDLVLWDHGGGPNGGFGGDSHCNDPSNPNTISFSGLLDVLSDNDVTKDGGKFDFIDFDACLMSSLDIVLAFSDYTDYYIASPELEQGYGQDYKGWLDAVGDNARIDTYDLGKIIVDDMMSFYETEGSEGYGLPATLTLFNTKKLVEGDIVSAMTEFTDIMKQDLYNPNKDGEYYFYDEFFAWASSIIYGEGSENYYDLGVVMEILSGNFINFVDGNDTSTYTKAANRVIDSLCDDEAIYARCTENVKTSEPVFYSDTEGSYDLSDFASSGVYLPAVMPKNRTRIYTYFVELDAALELMKDGPVKTFLEKYETVMSDYALLSETGFAVSVLSASGFERDDINYDLICKYWQNCYVPEGWTDSIIMSYVKFYISKHEGGEADIKTWIEPYIRQMADEVIDPENISVKVVEGTGSKTYIVNIDDTHKRLIDSVSLTYTAELPVVEEYWENSPYKNYRYSICPDLVLGRREADVEIDVEDGETRFEALTRWFDDRSSTWEIESLKNQWYAITDADGVAHVAIIEFPDNDVQIVPAIATDEDGDSALVGLCFADEELIGINEYGSDLLSPTRISVSEILCELTLMPIYYDYQSGLNLVIPLSKSTFKLNAENADSIRLIFTDVENIPDIDDINGDGNSITEELVVNDMYDYSFNISDKYKNPDAVLISIEDAEVEAAVYDGTEKRPVVVYNGEVLTEGRDYAFFNASESDDFIECGNYEIIIYGKGEYGGTLEAIFNIYEADDFAAPEEFAKMSAIDFEQKTGKEVTAIAARESDGTVTVAIMDEVGDVVDVYTLDSKTGTGTTYFDEDVDLPQTGMSGVHKAVTGLAALMLLSGAVLVKKGRREDAE